jgi:hypothetical protein
MVDTLVGFGAQMELLTTNGETALMKVAKSYLIRLNICPFCLNVGF